MKILFFVANMKLKLCLVHLFLMHSSTTLGNSISSSLSTSGNQISAANGNELRIVKILAPKFVENGSENVTLDCMFKFDKKLDERLAVKWFLNDEPEPIYQFIPALKVRTFADKFEHLFDRTYKVSNDIDFLLAAYKSTLSLFDNNVFDQTNHSTNNYDAHQDQDLAALSESKQLLASKLEQLATLNDKQKSIQILNSLRSALLLSPCPHSNHQDLPSTTLNDLYRNDDDSTSGLALPTSSTAASSSICGGQNQDLNKDNNNSNHELGEEDLSFRAVRFKRATPELSGKFTCSVSSLGGFDSKSAQLIVFEPPGRLFFNATPVAGGYNVSCGAEKIYPSPSLTIAKLSRPPRHFSSLTSHQNNNNKPQVAPANHKQVLPLNRVSVVDRVAIKHSLMPLVTNYGQNNELTMKRKRRTSMILDGDDYDELTLPSSTLQQQQQQVLQLASGWTVVEDSSLSSTSITQFECVISVEAANFERRLTLSLLKGSHQASIGSAAFVGTATNSFLHQQTTPLGLSRSTLLAVFTALVSVLCLILTLASVTLLVKYIKKLGKRRQQIHNRSVSSHLCLANATGAPKNSDQSNETKAKLQLPVEEDNQKNFDLEAASPSISLNNDQQQIFFSSTTTPRNHKSFTTFSGYFADTRLLSGTIKTISTNIIDDSQCGLPTNNPQVYSLRYGSTTTAPSLHLPPTNSPPKPSKNHHDHQQP